MFCQNCGASMADGAKFCPECGAQQAPRAASAPAQNLCPFCGGALEADSVFCDNCGQRLDGSAPSYRRRDAAYSPHAAAPGQDGRTGYTPSRPQTSGRRSAVSARPEMRILGIPVRGKAMWIALAVIAAVLIRLAIYSKLGGEKKPAEDSPRSFAERDEQPDAEAGPAESASAFDFAARADEKRREAQSQPEADTEPEPGPEAEQAQEAEPDPGPETEPEEPQEASLPFASSLGAPAATDFAWIPDVQTGDLTGSFLSNDELLGKWKGEIIYDGVWELVYVTIDTSGRITIEPYQINYGDGWEDETGGERYLFDGTFDVSGVYGAGDYGSLSLYTFLESHGTQYGTGTFSVRNESNADIYLVRP